MRCSDLISELLFTQVSQSLATDFMPFVISWVCICQTMSNNQLMIVIDHTGNQQGKGVKDFLIRLRSSVSILSYWFFFLTLSRQINLSIVDSDRTRNSQTQHHHPPTHPPQILGAIGHLRYNEFSVLMNFGSNGFPLYIAKMCKLYFDYGSSSYHWNLYRLLQVNGLSQGVISC